MQKFNFMKCNDDYILKDKVFMDFLDKKILNRIQANFPIVSRPYEFIAREIGVTEERIIFSISSFKRNGIIRRIGGNFVPSKIGFVSTLCAASVKLKKLKRFSKVVNSFTGVTHNYIRDSKYNVWFTFIAKDDISILRNLKIIVEKTGVSQLLNLPAKRVFKVSAKFLL